MTNPKHDKPQPLNEETMALIVRAVFALTEILGTAARLDAAHRDRRRIDRQDWRMN